MAIFNRLFGKKNPREEKPAKIGSSRVLLALSPSAVSLLKEGGIGTQYNVQEMACIIMAEEFGKREELFEVSPGRVQLSLDAVARCITTPIYTNAHGGMYVLFEKVDERTRQQEGLTFVRNIDPRGYLGALCGKFNLFPALG